MHNIITADECRKQLQNAGGVERQVTEKMVARVDAAVRQAVKQGKATVTVTIPTFHFGLPDFDTDEVEKNVREIFSDHGFVVSASDNSPNTFELHWGVSASPLVTSQTVQENTTPLTRSVTITTVPSKKSIVLTKSSD